MINEEDRREMDERAEANVWAYFKAIVWTAIKIYVPLWIACVLLLLSFGMVIGLIAG
jgi:hypothetical protein